MGMSSRRWVFPPHRSEFVFSSAQWPPEDPGFGTAPSTLCEKLTARSRFLLTNSRASSSPRKVTRARLCKPRPGQGDVAECVASDQLEGYTRRLRRRGLSVDRRRLRSSCSLAPRCKAMATALFMHSATNRSLQRCLLYGYWPAMRSCPSPRCFSVRTSRDNYQNRSAHLLNSSDGLLAVRPVEITYYRASSHHGEHADIPPHKHGLA